MCKLQNANHVIKVNLDAILLLIVLLFVESPMQSAMNQQVHALHVIQPRIKIAQ